MPSGKPLLGWILGVMGLVLVVLVTFSAVACNPFDNDAKATSDGAVVGDNGNLTSGNGGGVSDPQGSHFTRLESLDPTYRSQGYLAWLSAAGVKCQAVVQARQPEEETSPSGKISVAGLQISATQCHVPWPNIVTTDTPSRVVSKDSNSVEHKPDPNNGSVLYTNVTVTGPVTIWIDGSNWGQFTSKLGKPGSAGAQSTVQPSAANEVKSIDDLKSFGTVIQPLSADGYLAGAQVRLNKDFTAPPGFVIQKQGAEVASASAGDTVSIWVPQAFRVKQ